MGTNRMRRVAVLGLLGILPFGGSSANAGLFDRWFNRTTYVEVVPTVYTDPMVAVTPTAYYATSYGMPGGYAYVSPTSYVETAWTIPTVYSATSYLPTSYYVASSYDASAYVPTAYYPTISTAYVVPTSYTYQPTSYAFYSPTVYSAPLGVVPTYYDAPLVATNSMSGCETKSGTPQAYRAREAEPMPTTKVKPVPPVVGSKAAEEKPPTAPKEEVKVTPERRETGTPPATGAMTDPKSIPDPTTGTPPAVPPATAGEAGLIDTPTPAPASPTKLPASGDTSGTSGSATPPPPKAPAAPSDENVTPTRITPEGEVRRENFRPTLASRRYVRSTASGDLNLLEGRVKSAQDGSLLEGIQIRVSNLKDSRRVRNFTSNASGRYSVNLPDGEWSLSVADGNGVMHWVRDLIVTNGQIVDDRGRDVPALTITW